MLRFPAYSAYASVSAGVAVTLLHLHLTVNSGKSWEASARVAALSCVHAGGAVRAGMVMGAEVQIWGREKLLFTGSLNCWEKSH